MKPSKVKSAYTFFNQEFRTKYNKKHPNQVISVKDSFILCARGWKTMSHREKKKYVDMNRLDHARYLMEEEIFKMENEENGTPDENIDPNEPKRPLSAYLYFCKEHGKGVKERNPDFKITDVGTALGQMWKECKEKYIYEEQSLKAKQLYKKQGTKKDPKKPKRPLSSYFYFCEEHRKSVTEKNPELKITDVGRTLGNMWRECKDKHIYEEKSLKAKAVYKIELKLYKDAEALSKMKTGK